ncbi:RhoGAP domain [Phytophthora infestans]|uniref:RhoGAP domain n=1 Tax=Phytophthora infestans TaxID=4787 RepID=A0A8S9TU16_PHYIN|nr:RhoGAP domain [Phytophthora infestans]
MKHRSWIKVIAALSPRTAFRKTKSNPTASDAAASPAPPIPLSMLATLARVVQFLDKSYLEEEDLYSKPGVGLERQELLRLCRCNQLPDLSVYSPHSIATVVKEILGERYEPLIPADISQQLLEAVSAGQMDDKAENDVTEIFKQIPFSTREFLQVFLNHLHTVAASGSSRLSVANLALNVGIALVRPPEDKTTVNSKLMMRRRKCIAEFLIRQAPSLPYDCATEMNIPAIPEEITASMVDTTDPASTKQLHFIQATWDAYKTSFAIEQLEQIFSKFGQIESLGVNALGNRAIIAYTNTDGAEAAEQASTPALRIRRRKPRRDETRREYSPRSSDHSKPLSNLSVHDESSTIVLENDSVPSRDLSEPESKLGPIMETDVAEQSQDTEDNPIDETIVVEDIEDDQYDDVPDQAKTTRHLQPNENTSLTNINDQRKEQEAKRTVNDESLQQNLVNNRQMTQLIVPEGQEVAEPVRITTELDASEAVAATEIGHQKELGDDTALPPRATSLDDELAHEKHGMSVENSAVRESLPVENEQETIDEITAQKDKTFLPEAAEQVESSALTSELAAKNATPTSGQDDFNLSTAPTKNAVSIGELQSRLLDMEKILCTSTSALSSTKLTNEFERAVLQLHKQILDMVAECLVFAGLRHGDVSAKSMGTTTAEFLDFLEAQSKTQVKILEVEVRAGQELLRLHKTQYEKERAELDEEITALRVGRTEAERLCAELRTDLRKCRSELACHVANATDIQRQKSVLEEKLASSEDKLHAKEVALVKLQVEYDNMHRVATEAQMRVEKLKQGDTDCHNTLYPEASKKVTSTRATEDLPHTSKLFSKLLNQSIDKVVEEQPGLQAEVKLDTFTNASRSSNVAALEAMKQQMTHEIQEQLAATRAALREMEICSSSGKTLQEEEEELRQLQQQVAARAAEMDTAMSESRSKLNDLLDPVAAFSFHGGRVGSEEKTSNQEPTIFDSTALVNELIARAEKNPEEKSTQYDGGFYSARDVQSAFPRIDNQQLSHYHRPAQSALYEKWTTDRSRKIAQLASYRDQQTVLRAQQSMQTFQQALAEVRENR